MLPKIPKSIGLPQDGHRQTRAQSAALSNEGMSLRSGTRTAARTTSPISQRQSVEGSRVTRGAAIPHREIAEQGPSVGVAAAVPMNIGRTTPQAPVGVAAWIRAGRGGRRRPANRVPILTGSGIPGGLNGQSGGNHRAPYMTTAAVIREWVEGLADAGRVTSVSEETSLCPLPSSKEVPVEQVSYPGNSLEGYGAGNGPSRGRNSQAGLRHAAGNTLEGSVIGAQRTNRVSSSRVRPYPARPNRRSGARSVTQVDGLSRVPADQATGSEDPIAPSPQEPTPSQVRAEWTRFLLADPPAPASTVRDDSTRVGWEMSIQGPPSDLDQTDSVRQLPTNQSIHPVQPVVAASASTVIPETPLRASFPERSRDAFSPYVEEESGINCTKVVTYYACCHYVITSISHGDECPHAGDPIIQIAIEGSSQTITMGDSQTMRCGGTVRANQQCPGARWSTTQDKGGCDSCEAADRAGAPREEDLTNDGWGVFRISQASTQEL